MKKSLFIVAVLLAVAAGEAPAQDMREAVRKAEADRKAAEARALEVEAKIVNDRAALTAELARLEAEQKQLEADIKALQAEKGVRQKTHETVSEKWSGKEVEFREVSGNVRTAARDIEALLNQSPMTALSSERLEQIQPLVEQGYFPDIDDIAGMTDVLFAEMESAAQVQVRRGNYIARDGESTEGDILALGRFTTMYRNGDEVGFLTYAGETNQLIALSVLPRAAMGRTMKKYFEGKSEVVPFDISGGESLQQFTHNLSLLEEFKLGGPIMWPILLVGLSVLLFTVYKVVYLKRVHGDTDKVMGTVIDLAARGDWAGVDAYMQGHKNHNWPVVNVLRDGIRARNEDRETVESVLQESILREMPRLDRGLSVMAALGAISPLLGLLGTVTGMIATFNVITVYGTGDPKLMSGGISEALVATKWGLCIAVPTMLLHVFLSRRANTVVADMEEKAVGLSNIIQKEQRGGSLAASA